MASQLHAPGSKHRLGPRRCLLDKGPRQAGCWVNIPRTIPQRRSKSRTPRGIVTYHRLLMNGAFGNYRDLMRDDHAQSRDGPLPEHAEQPQRAGDRRAAQRELRARADAAVHDRHRAAESERHADRRRRRRTGAGVHRSRCEGARAHPAPDGRSATASPATRCRREARDAETTACRWKRSRRTTTPTEKMFLGRHSRPGQSASEDPRAGARRPVQSPEHRAVRQPPVDSATGDVEPESRATCGTIAAVFSRQRRWRARRSGGGRARDPDASRSGQRRRPPSGKLAEPVLFVVSMLRAFDASVTDHPFMADKAEEMGQKVFYPPSVFSYFSPGYRVRGTAAAGRQPLGGPEFQILTSVTALVRANFVGDAARPVTSATTSRSTTPRSRRAPATRRRWWTTATCCSWAAACRPRSAAKSSPP